MSLLTEQAREALNLPPEWQGYQFTCLPPPRDGQRDWVFTHFSITGAVAPLVTRGKRKGEHNWSKLDKSTVREFVTSIADHDAFALEWERKNNLCHACHGKGEVLHLWTVKDGTTYKPCNRCKGEKTARP